MRFGHNTNIPHRGRMYHIQTEDSGERKGRIFTHVFYRGAIISSEKVQYSGPEGVQAVQSAHPDIPTLMKKSHVAMIRRLRHGHLDSRIDQMIE